jgi:hypothetical protein
MDFARLGVLFEEDEGELLNLYSVFWQQESPPPRPPASEVRPRLLLGVKAK